jgi:hypothetical protein
MQEWLNVLVYICASGPYGLCTAHRGPCIAKTLYTHPSRVGGIDREHYSPTKCKTLPGSVSNIATGTARSLTGVP